MPPLGPPGSGGNTTHTQPRTVSRRCIPNKAHNKQTSMDRGWKRTNTAARARSGSGGLHTLRAAHRHTAIHSLSTCGFREEWLYTETICVVVRPSARYRCLWRLIRRREALWKGFLVEQKQNYGLAPFALDSYSRAISSMCFGTRDEYHPGHGWGDDREQRGDAARLRPDEIREGAMQRRR